MTFPMIHSISRTRALSAFFAVLAGVSLALSPMTAFAADGSPLITKLSAHDAATTLDRLAGILEKKGITIFARVDHAKGAKSVELDLPPTELLVFGNPKLGTPLMQANRGIGIDLPMKALAWTDVDGKTYLSYTDPAKLSARWGIGDRAAVFKKMTGALDKMTTAATSE
ncbi:MAG: DUF302 domain-containing protein [Pseudomonadota bacterium]